VDDVCICTTEPRPRVLVVAPMEAGMGMSCWILMTFVRVEPVEDKVSFWDHQTPGWNHLWDSNIGSLCTWSTWHTRERRNRGHARQVDSRRHLDGFRHFMVHLNHNEVYIGVCEAKLRPWCNMYLM
jgi:hypothetical protein